MRPHCLSPPEKLRIVREAEVVNPAEMIAIADAKLQESSDEKITYRYFGSADLCAEALMPPISIMLQLGRWEELFVDTPAPLSFQSSLSTWDPVVGCTMVVVGTPLT